MSADADTVIIPKIVPGSPLEMFRPVQPSRGIGSRLRGFIGVQEDILDWAPEERSRYTKLSVIVINTGLMAALSLLAALHSISAYWPYLIPVALFWGYLIVSFDGWLVASTHGRLTARLRVFAPRLILSILIGSAIAEPMVLWVFQPAIQKEILDDRQNQITTYSGQLTMCNPISGQIIDTAACSGFHVNVTDAPSSVQDQLNRTTDERNSEQDTVNQLNNEMTTLRNTTNNECAGAAGADLTGVRGDGPDCLRDRQNELNFQSYSHLDQHEQNLTSLNNQISTQTGQLNQAKKTFGSQVTAAIAAQVRQKRADQGTIGILDELKGLSILASAEYGRERRTVDAQAAADRHRLSSGAHQDARRRNAI